MLVVLVAWHGEYGRLAARHRAWRDAVLRETEAQVFFVERVDVVTSAPTDRNEETVLITDAAIWRLGSRGFEPASLHDGVTPEGLSFRTGFEFACESPPVTAPPSESELAALHSIDGAGLRYQLLTGTTHLPAVRRQEPIDPPPPASSSHEKPKARKR